jgi:hypothetical protein
LPGAVGDEFPPPPQAEYPAAMRRKTTIKSNFFI